MDKITESLKTLLHLGTQISFFDNVISEYKKNEQYLNEIKLQGFYSDKPFTKTVSGFLQNYQTIIICSLLDEFDREFTPIKHPNFSDKILNVKKITKPIRKRISQWKDLKNFRNHILAHNLRENNNSIFSNKNILKTYKIPFSNSEHQLLVQLSLLIVNLTSEIFQDIVSKIDSTENILSRINLEYNEINTQEEYLVIYTECLEQLKNYS